MKNHWSNFSEFQYSKTSWLFARVLFIAYWFDVVLKSLVKYHETPIPQGIFGYVSISPSTMEWLNPVLLALSAVLVLFYVFNYNLASVTCLLFLISVYALSIEESNGVFKRVGLLSIILLVQFVALLTACESKRFSCCMSFSVQAIAAAYSLSALSKLSSSGFGWIWSGKSMALQVLKSYHYNYATTGIYSHMEKGNKISTFIINHPFLVTCLLTLTLLLELFAILACTSKRMALFHGLALCAMHWSIYVVMNINIRPIWYPMFLFFVLPNMIETIENLLKRNNQKNQSTTFL